MGPGHGSVVPGRGTGVREAKTFLGLALETQTDIVIFLTEQELVDPVTAGIHSAGRLEKRGTGVVFALPVEAVAGIKVEIVRREPG